MLIALLLCFIVGSCSPCYMNHFYNVAKHICGHLGMYLDLHEQRNTTHINIGLHLTIVPNSFICSVTHTPKRLGLKGTVFQGFMGVTLGWL